MTDDPPRDQRRHTSQLLDMLKHSTPKPTVARRDRFGTGNPRPAPPVVPTIPLPSDDGRVKPMPQTNLQRVAERLRQPKGDLAKLLARANHMLQINRVFHAYLPPQYQPHATIVAVDLSAWQVQTDSPAWATRLRYALPTIRRQMSGHLNMEIPKFTIRVRPREEAETAVAAPKRQLQLTQESAAVLTGTAATVNDRKLGQLLERIAGRARKKSGA